MSNQNVQYTLSLKDMLTNKLKDADTAAKRFEGTMTGLQSKVGSLGAAIGATFGVAAVTAFANNMIQSGAKVENALTGLTTLLKDQAAAQQVINTTMEDATKTPFAFEGLLAANKALISAGVSATDARTDVLNLANAIAATGGGDDELGRMVVNLQQIKNTGKATALDIKQFAYAGVNIYKLLADATGLPIEKTKDMEVSYDMLTYALRRAGEEGGAYANGLANMANNTSVRISNLGDSVFQLSVQMFNDLKPAVDFVITGLQNFIQTLRQGWEWMVRNKEMLQQVATVVLYGAAAYGVYWTVTTGVTTAIGIMRTAVLALNAAMMANPIGFVIGALVALGTAIVVAYNKVSWFRGAIWATWNVLKEGASIISDVFDGLRKTIEGVLTFDPKLIASGVEQVIGTVRDTATRIGRAAKDGYEAGVADLAKGQAKTTASPVVAATTKAVKAGGMPAMDTQSETKKAQGSKAVTINVKIENLVRDFQIKTTNIQEGAGKVKEMITQTMLAALNDSQLIAE